MPLATLLKKDTLLYLLSSDDFHTKNLQPNDRAYHWGSKTFVTVHTFNEKTGDWLCTDGTFRDSYKLKKVIAQDWEIILSDTDAIKIGYVDITSSATEFVRRRFDKIELEKLNEYQKGMIDGIVLFYPEIVKRLNIEKKCEYKVSYEQENMYFRVELIN